MNDQLFHPLITIDETYLRGRAENIDIELTDQQLIEISDELEILFEREHVVSQIHDMAEKIIFAKIDGE